MSKLTIVADIFAKEDKVELVKAALLDLIAPTRAEAGCLQYDLHQDNENPAHFLFFEIWESRALWQDHMVADHIKAFGELTDGAIEKAIISEMSHIG